MSETLRIASWNIQGHHNFNIDGFAEELRELKPNVICLQEVQAKQAHALSSLLGMELMWSPKHYPLIRPAEGLAILSDQPISEPETRTIHRALPFSYRRRIAQRAQISLGDHQFTVLNVHLSFGPRADPTIELSRALDDRDIRNVIVAGDYNLRPNNKPLLLHAFVDVDPNSTQLTNYSHSDERPDQRLDYVFLGANFMVQDFHHINANNDPQRWKSLRALSDHVPVTADIALRS